MIRQNRGAIVFGVFLFGLMFALAFLTSEQEKGDGSPSSYSNLRRGAKAAFLLLQQSGYPIERWERPPSQLPQNAEGTLLIVADPESFPHTAETGALAQFLLRGGTILVAGFFPNSFVPKAAVDVGEVRIGGTECRPIAPTHLTRGGSISLDGTLVWDSKDASQVIHFGDKDGKGVVVSYAVGKGQVMWWASAWPLENAGIREKNNLELLLNSVTGYRRVLWDEYYHQRRYERVSDKPVRVYRWAFAQLALLGILVVLTYSRRSGPLVPLPEGSRLSPLEFVETLGNVFRRARSTQVAVEIAFQRLRQVAGRRLGIRGTASSAEIVDAMAQRGIRLPEPTTELVRQAEEAVSDPELSEKAALAYVRALNEAIAVLNPTSKKNKG